MAAPVLRQFATNNTTGLAFGSNLVANSYIVVGIATDGGNAFNGITSSAGNTYSIIQNAGSGFVLFSGPNTAGAVPETISIQTTPSGASFMVICEVTGTFAAKPLDSFGSITFASSPATLNPFTTQSLNTLILILSGFAAGSTNPVTMTGAYSGFTISVQPGSFQTFLASGTEAAVGTYAPTMTFTGSGLDVWSVALASQAPASGGSGSLMTLLGI